MKNGIGKLTASVLSGRGVFIPLEFVNLTGSIVGAVFLSKLIEYHLASKGEWFWKTSDEWAEETTLSFYQLREISKHLVKMGIMDTMMKRPMIGNWMKQNPVMHYRLNVETLERLLEESAGKAR